MRIASDYCGRFAPSPSGPLHFGSLIAALGSFLQARRAGGRWLVRIEDLDTPRNQPGAIDTILEQLRALHLHPDSPVVRQSARLRAYQQALLDLQARGLCFPCACSRADLAEGIYPGTCRERLPPGKQQARSIRLRATSETIGFDDGLQPRFTQNIARDVGDFVIRRADNIIAYHLAVVVDDAWQQVTEVVRGADLLDSTPRQIFLQRQLRLPTPAYVHLPLAIGPDGAKLSKQNGARPLDTSNPGSELWRALTFLGQSPPASLRDSSPEAVLAWAIAHWTLQKVSAVVKLPLTA